MFLTQSGRQVHVINIDGPSDDNPLGAVMVDEKSFKKALVDVNVYLATTEGCKRGEE